MWVTCIRGKEKQAVGELYDLFEQVHRSPLASSASPLTGTVQLASEMWPIDASESKTQAVDDADSDVDDAEDEDIEKQIAKEMSGMKRPRKETRFGMSSLISLHVEADKSWAI